MFRAQERYMIILGAPTSIAQRQGEDTLTYLNKGREGERGGGREEERERKK